MNIFDDENKDILNTLVALPNSCSQSADYLEKQRQFYEKENVFPKGTIDAFISKLKSYNDENLSEELFGKKEKTKELVDKYIHCM